MMYCNTSQSHCNISSSPEHYEASVKPHQVKSLNLDTFLSTRQTHATDDVVFQSYSGT